jgi:hypothetical protein
LFTDVQVEAVTFGVEPEAGAVSDGRKFGKAVDIDAWGAFWLRGVLRFLIFKKFADMDVGVALGAGDVAIHGDGPLIAPEIFGFGDGEGPEGEAFVGRHLCEGVGAVVRGSGEGEPAVGLGGVVVFQKEDDFCSGTFVGFETEAAGSDGSRFG